MEAPYVTTSRFVNLKRMCTAWCDARLDAFENKCGFFASNNTNGGPDQTHQYQATQNNYWEQINEKVDVFNRKRRSDNCADWNGESQTWSELKVRFKAVLTSYFRKYSLPHLLWLYRCCREGSSHGPDRRAMRPRIHWRRLVGWQLREVHPGRAERGVHWLLRERRRCRRLQSSMQRSLSL